MKIYRWKSSRKSAADIKGDIPDRVYWPIKATKTSQAGCAEGVSNTRKSAKLSSFFEQQLWPVGNMDIRK